MKTQHKVAAGHKIESTGEKGKQVASRSGQGRRAMERILTDIQNGTWKPVYLFYGEETYLRNQYRDRLVEAVNAGEMNSAFYGGKDINIGEVIDFAETMPFLAEYRLVVIDQPELSADAAAALAEYFAESPETTVILYCTDRIDARSKLFKTISNRGIAVKFSTPQPQELKAWVGETMRTAGRGMTGQAYDLLIERSGTDMLQLSNDMEKLIAYTHGRDTVKASDVDALCAKQTEAKVFDMISEIAYGNQKKAMSVYHDLLTSREEPMLILRLLMRQFNQLYVAKALQAEGKGIAVIQQELQLKYDSIVRKILSQANRFTLAQLRGALDECVSLETDVKSGKINDRISVELIILRYSSNLFEGASHDR